MRDRLRDQIRKRTVAIMVHGASIKELEDHIENFEGSNICWTSLGVFPMMQEYILKKGNLMLEIVQDMATVSGGFHDYYENKVRLPRIRHFLETHPDNTWITSWGVIRDSVAEYNPHWVAKEWQKEGTEEADGCYSEQIQIADHLVEPDEIPIFMDVPNSVTLMIGCMLAGGASKIILFGLDGYKGTGPCPAEVCYHPELIEAERKVAIGNIKDSGINRDTEGFQERFPTILEWYRKKFKNNAPIYNCSPDSVIDVIPKINYAELGGVLDEL